MATRALIKLAAQMVRGLNMPPDPGDLGMRLSRVAVFRLRNISEVAHEQARRWGIELRSIADALSVPPEPGKKRGRPKKAS